jgi:hypothetical protein
MSLPDWERNGWLQSHKCSPNEVRDLLAVVDRDLADSAAVAQWLKKYHPELLK